MGLVKEMSPIKAIATITSTAMIMSLVIIIPTVMRNTISMTMVRRKLTTITIKVTITAMVTIITTITRRSKRIPKTGRLSPSKISHSH